VLYLYHRLDCFFDIYALAGERISDMYRIAYLGWYSTTGDQSPANIIISEFVYTNSKERMIAQIISIWPGDVLII